MGMAIDTKFSTLDSIAGRAGTDAPNCVRAVPDSRTVRV
eukprot:SAG31_NODE_1096_length_9920_cov_14.794216_9_plen_39_part_00